MTRAALPVRGPQLHAALRSMSAFEPAGGGNPWEDGPKVNGIPGSPAVPSSRVTRPKWALPLLLAGSASVEMTTPVEISSPSYPRERTGNDRKR